MEQIIENKDYSEMSKRELWKEIISIVNATHFIEEDKGLFLKLIQEYDYR